MAVLRLGGLAMIAVGILLLTGAWDQLTAILRRWAAQFTTVLYEAPGLDRAVKHRLGRKPPCH